MKRNRSITYSDESPIYFITSTVTEKLPIFFDYALCKIILENLDFYRKKINFAIYGYVIMPTHIHLLMQQLGEKNVSDFMKGVKEFSSKQIIKYLKNTVGSGDPTLTTIKSLPNVPVRSLDLTADQLLEQFRKSAIRYKQKGDYQVWQEHFDDVIVWSDKQLNVKLDYIHDNPCKDPWSLVNEPQEYKYSSARNYFLDDDSVFEIDRLEV